MEAYQGTHSMFYGNGIRQNNHLNFIGNHLWSNQRGIPIFISGIPPGISDEWIYKLLSVSFLILIIITNDLFFSYLVKYIIGNVYWINKVNLPHLVLLNMQIVQMYYVC
jgi:hypothetical protein